MQRLINEASSAVASSGGLYSQLAGSNMTIKGTQAYLKAMRFMYDQSSKLPEAQGVQGITEAEGGMNSFLEAIIQDERHDIDQLPTYQRRTRLRSIVRRLQSVVGSENLTPGVRQRLDDTEKRLLDEANQYDPARVAWRESERMIDSTLTGSGERFAATALLGKSGRLGGGWLQKATEELKKSISQGIAESAAHGVVSGVIKPGIETMARSLMGGLRSVFGEMTQANMNVVASIAGLYSAFGRGASKKRRSGGLFGGILGAVAGSLLPGLGWVAGASIGAGLGGSLADSDMGGALLTGLAGYGAISKGLSKSESSGAFDTGWDPSSGSFGGYKIGDGKSRSVNVTMNVKEFNQAKDTNWRFSQADSRIQRVAVTS